MADRRKSETVPASRDDKVATIRKTFDRYMDGWREIREEMQADMNCLLDPLGPWPEAERTARSVAGNMRPCLHEDIISQFNNRVINQMEMNPMGIDAQPEGDGADEDTAEEVENRIRQICYEQNEQHSVMNAARSAVQCGIGGWELDTDWKSHDSWEQYICIKPIMDPFTFLPDPEAKEPDWSDMQGCFKCWRLSHEEFKQKYPNATVQSFDGFIRDKQYSAWVDDHSIQIAVFWNVRKKRRTLLLLDDGTPEGWSIFEDELTSKLPFKRKGKAMVITDGSYAEVGYEKGREFPILQESKRFVPRVFKTLTNGLEILDETEWEDEEIPVLIVTGRMSFQPTAGGGPGKRVVESLTRKGRTGQILYDHCISSIQEESGMVPKSVLIGYEGQFDTATDWATLNRQPVAYAEAKATTEEAGSDKPLPLPTIIQRRAQIDQLLLLKDSILLSLQNALGISSTERVDRAAKSGKAIDALEQAMDVATYHFYNSKNMAQLRQYRIMNRLLPKIESTSRQVGLRDVKGNFSVKKIPDGHYQAKHQIVISSQKYYQSLQQEQSDFAQQLLASVKDPMLLLAVLPGLIRMKGLGPFGDDLAKMIEAMQPPQMQQARGDGGDQTAALQQALQQAQKAMEAVNAHAKALETQVIELEEDVKADKVKADSQERITAENNATKIKIEQMKIEAEREIKKLELLIERVRLESSMKIAGAKNMTDVHRDSMKLDHADEQQDKQLIAAEIEAERNREHEKETSSEKP